MNRNVQTCPDRWDRQDDDRQAPLGGGRFILVAMTPYRRPRAILPAAAGAMAFQLARGGHIDRRVVPANVRPRGDVS